MVWSLRGWRRERALRRGRLDDALWRRALARFAFARDLDAGDAARLREWVTLFLHNKTLSAAGGLDLTDTMRVEIALQACILILELDIDSYDGWSEVIVYPEGFLVDQTWTDEAGIVHQGKVGRIGEAWLRGPVVLSWADADAGAGMEGAESNVVIHEFAHKLDMLNGPADGFPPLHKGMNRNQWNQAFRGAFGDFRLRVRSGLGTRIDPYAAESPAEFFAVLSEVFFMAPQVALATYPAVYRQLTLFYRQDPAARLAVPNF